MATACATSSLSTGVGNRWRAPSRGPRAARYVLVWPFQIGLWLPAKCRAHQGCRLTLRTWQFWQCLWCHELRAALISIHMHATSCNNTPRYGRDVGRTGRNVGVLQSADVKRGRNMRLKFSCMYLACKSERTQCAGDGRGHGEFHLLRVPPGGNPGHHPHVSGHPEGLHPRHIFPRKRPALCALPGSPIWGVHAQHPAR